MKIKKVGGILGKPTPKKGKERKGALTTEALHLVKNVYEDDNCNR